MAELLDSMIYDLTRTGRGGLCGIIKKGRFSKQFKLPIDGEMNGDMIQEMFTELGRRMAGEYRAWQIRQG